MRRDSTALNRGDSSEIGKETCDTRSCGYRERRGKGKIIMNLLT